jgi:hypothetical protein
MFQCATATTSLDNVNGTAAKLEEYRARLRRSSRKPNQNWSGSAQVDSLDVEGGRARKIPAKWRRNEQRRTGVDDGHWPQAAGTEMHVGYNAFDFSSCPEAFEDVGEPASPFIQPQQMSSVEKEVTSMRFTSAAMWGSSVPGTLGGSKQHAAPDQNDMRRPPLHSVSIDERCRALYYQ